MNGIMKFAALVVATVSGLGVHAANVWYVDDDAAAGGNGSEATPYKTIQDAINASTTLAGDTILVKPGTYAEGGKSYGRGIDVNYIQPCRVYVNKSLTIKSTGGKEVTHIVGVPGNRDAEEKGEGGATLCIMSDAQNCVYEGFTLRDGTACWNSGGAGGVCAGGNGYVTNRYTLIDCVISNCIGQTGAMHSGVAIRCRFVNNYGRKQATAYFASLYNCLLEGQQQGSFVTKNCGPIVNCTIVNNVASKPTYVDSGNVKADGGGHYYNCVIYGNGNAFSDANGVYHNCLVDGTAYAAASERVTEIARDSSSTAAPFLNLYMSPLTGDYRPVSGGTIATAGDSTLYPSDIIPEKYRQTDFNGDPIASGAAIPAGILLPAAVPATAPLAQTSGYKFKFNGFAPVCAGHVFQSDTWPVQVYVEPSDDSPNMMALSFQPYGSAGNTHHWFAGGKGVWVTVPPFNAELGALQLYAQACSKNLYVDGNLQDYSGHDGTDWTKAFKTIQEAVTAANGSPTWIRVRGGTYAEGEGIDDSLGKTRVLVDNGSAAILVEGVDGAANTTIVGDDDHRCMILKGNKVGVAGFTFKGGKGSDYGGGVYAGNTYPTVQDCRFTECKAGKNSAATCGGTLVRCLFDRNSAPAGMSRSGYSVGCIYCNNAVTASRQPLSMYSGHKGFNCTIYDANAGVNLVVNSDTDLINVVLAAGGNLAESTAVLAGNVVSPYGLVSHAAFSEDQFWFVEPVLADPANGNFRPVTTSPVFGAGVLATTGYRPEVLCRYVTCDYENNPVLAADGTVASGAIAKGREAVSYYVNASAVDDSGDGLSEETAKKTLAGAMKQLPLLAGDEVVALPGVYDDDDQIHTEKTSGGSITIRSRVAVPGGVTLRSRDGAETTVIKGADATSPDAYGCGTDAIRGAYVAATGLLKGFTVCGGRTATMSDTDKYGDDQIGGGILGKSYYMSHVEDCIVSNNVASNGGGASYVNCRRCRFLDNVAPRYAGAVRYGSLYNCYFAGNRGDRVTECLYDCVNCTYGDNEKLDGSASVIFENMGYCATLANVVVCGKVRTGVSAADQSALNAKALYNCIFPKEMRVKNPPEDAVGLDMTHTLEELRAQFVDGYPASKDSVAVDAGFALAEAGDADVLGAARVQNAALDIGAFEYSWLGDYGKALGRRVEVTETEEVVETDGEVTMSDGGKLAATWTMSADGSAPDCACTVSATLDGTGTLYVYLNGEPVGTLTTSGTVRFDNTQAANDLVVKYVGEGSATLGRFRRELGLSVIIR